MSDDLVENRSVGDDTRPRIEQLEYQVETLKRILICTLDELHIYQSGANQLHWLDRLGPS